jgi:hypothetical protein
MEIKIDITEVVGPKISDCRNIGLVPDELDGRDLHFSAIGATVVIRDYQTDETIVTGYGWKAAMHALADHYGVPVRVSCDPGVTGGPTRRLVGLWIPSQAA